MQSLKNISYQALELLTLKRGIVRQIGGFAIRFPARWSRYYESNYEPETFKFFCNHLKPSDMVLDIGGHIGLFAVVASRIVGEKGRVFSFEPTPFTRQVLSEVVKLNDCVGNVEVRGEAMSKEKGQAVFYDTGDEISNANSLVKTERSKKGIEVTLTSVDEFAKERSLSVNCLKIDVEGAELDVLRGARATFLHSRPVARLGLHPPFIAQFGQTLEEIWDILESYKLRVEFEEKRVEREWFCAQQDLFDVNLLPS